MEAHDGPCEAPEVPVSKVRRQQWLSKQPQQSVSVPASRSTGPVAGIPAPPPGLNPDSLRPGSERDTVLLKRYGGVPFANLPRRSQEDLIASSAQVSLALLWVSAHEHFANGATSVTVSREYLERLVTPLVQQFVSNFIVNQG